MVLNIRSNTLILIVLLFLPACAPVIMGGGIVATTNLVGERRAVDRQLKDYWIGMTIRGHFVRSALVRVGNIGVSVYGGKVLLTGAAASQGELNEAVRIAKAVDGVTEVRSEIKVQYVSATELAADALITNRVKIQLLADKKVHGLDIHVKTTKSVVYLTGEAQNIQERDRAIDIVRQVTGVREVVSYVDIRTSK